MTPLTPQQLTWIVFIVAALCWAGILFFAFCSFAKKRDPHPPLPQNPLPDHPLEQEPRIVRWEDIC